MMDIIEDKLKKIHIVLVIVAVFVFQYLFPFVESTSNQKTLSGVVVNHETRITNLENGYLGNRELLMEIRFNLKQHVREQGGEYIESAQKDIEIK
jgi:hypothetical protein